jgi:hypothetical protein
MLGATRAGDAGSFGVAMVGIAGGRLGMTCGSTFIEREKRWRHELTSGFHEVLQKYLEYKTSLLCVLQSLIVCHVSL